MKEWDHNEGGGTLYLYFPRATMVSLGVWELVYSQRMSLRKDKEFLLDSVKGTSSCGIANRPNSIGMSQSGVKLSNPGGKHGKQRTIKLNGVTQIDSTIA